MLNSDSKEDSFKFLKKTNDACEWLWDCYEKCTVMCFNSAVMLYVISFLYNYYLKDEFEVKNLYQAFKL